MGLDRFEFQLFYECFQFQRVQLLVPALAYIMIEIVDQGPGNKKDPILQGEKKKAGKEFEFSVAAREVQPLYDRDADQRGHQGRE